MRKLPIHCHIFKYILIYVYFCNYCIVLLWAAFLNVIPLNRHNCSRGHGEIKTSLHRFIFLWEDSKWTYNNHKMIVTFWSILSTIEFALCRGQEGWKTCLALFLESRHCFFSTVCWTNLSLPSCFHTILQCLGNIILFGSSSWHLVSRAPLSSF